MPTKQSWYKNIVPYIKDGIYIIGILVSLFGWIKTKSKNEAVLETTIKYFEEFVTKQVDLNGKQAEINGTLMEFKNSHQ